MKNIFNIILAFIFMCASNTPVFAQLAGSRTNNFNFNSSVEFLNKMAKEAQKNQNPFDRLPPIFVWEKGLFRCIALYC